MSNKRIAVAAWESLFRAQVSVMRHLHADFPTDELSMNEYDVLFNLSAQEGRSMRIRDLNQRLLLTQPSVSRLIDRLVARDLVSKCSAPGDARGIIVQLTDAGYSLFRRVALEHMRSIEQRVGDALTAVELQQLLTLTSKLREAAP